jgi:hypothetical protein
MTAGVDQDRVRATWILCETLLDHLPEARQSSSVLGNSAGLTAGRLVPCGRCGGRGRVTGKGNPCATCTPRTSPNRNPAYGTSHGCVVCLICEGTGWRKRRAGDPEWDEYAGVELAPEPTDLLGQVRQALALEQERPELRDVALRRADRVLGEMNGVTHELGWVDAWKRKAKQGSYAELAAALEVLRDREPNRYGAIWHYVVLNEPIELSAVVQGFLNESMVVLASMMPDRIRVPKQLTDEAANAAAKTANWRGRTPAHARARRERDLEIQRLRYSEGWQVKRIAAHYGMTRQQIQKIAPPPVPSAPPAA